MDGLRADSLLLRRLALWGSRVGPDGWLRGAPAVCGWVFGAALGEQRRHVRENLRRLGVTSERAVYRTFAEYAACLAESLALSAGRAATVKLEVTGEARLRAALEAPTGVVVVTAHVGPWEAASSLLMRDHEAQVTLVMRREPDRQAGAFHDALRARAGLQVVHVGDDPLAALSLRRALGPRRVVALQLDRAGWRSGRPQVSMGPFRLAALTGAPLVSVLAARRGLFDYELQVGELQRPARGDEERARVAVERELWSWLQAHPTQWFDFL
ncbi:MAG: lysophospholipid acyltransferase family protein [Polyangiaceae bacterium]|nr:lysophospholipid acyltransferase family protein [Polyangiaceae bacterium]MCW5790977.1 lysophospholipid acyltransferase family protein [Polyangiaceae bacterium]